MRPQAFQPTIERGAGTPGTMATVPFALQMVVPHAESPSTSPASLIASPNAGATPSPPRVGRNVTESLGLQRAGLLVNPAPSSVPLAYPYRLRSVIRLRPEGVVMSRRPALGVHRKA
jgi:hypothetical protein